MALSSHCIDLTPEPDPCTSQDAHDTDIMQVRFMPPVTHRGFSFLAKDCDMTGQQKKRTCMQQDLPCAGARAAGRERLALRRLVHPVL